MVSLQEGPRVKILLVSQEYPPAVGGAGVVARQNAEELSRQGHEVTVLTRRWGVGPSQEGVRVIEAGGVRALWPLAMAWRLKRLRPKKYDAIIVNDIGAALVFVGLSGNSHCFGKSIYYLHGGEVDSILWRPRGFVRWLGLPRKLPGYIRACKQLVSVSAFMEGYFRDAFSLYIPPEKTSVVYAGVDPRQFYPSVGDKFNTLRNEADLILLSVSRVTREKGYAKKLEIFRAAIDQGLRPHWVVVGEGSYLLELKQQAEQQGLSQYLTFAGAVSRNSLRDYYSSADLFWLLSEREAFGLAYLEAQLCGCPALGCHTYGVEEAIDDGITGFLVHSSDEALDFLLHWDERKPGRRQVLANANRFSLETQVHRLVEILR